MSGEETQLPASLVNRILSKLEIDIPTTDLPGLATVYRACCRKIPFDNSLTMIDVQVESPGPLAGGVNYGATGCSPTILRQVLGHYVIQLIAQIVFFHQLAEPADIE
jgi:hypothetical protein